MRRPHVFLRLAAVCCSFLLVAGYVMYRSNAGVKAMPGSKSMRVSPEASAGATQPVSPENRAVFYGSKSAPVAIPVGTSQPSSPEVSNAPPPPQPTTAPVAAPATQRIFIGGSKSAAVLQPEDGQKILYGDAPTSQPAGVPGKP